MISYQWDCQKTMLKLKRELESKGLRVWMDVEKMKGDTLETMARAVEKSSVVLIAMSRKYQSSSNCRSGSFISITEFKQRRRQGQLQRHHTNQLINIIFDASIYIHLKNNLDTTRVLIGQKPTRLGYCAGKLIENCYFLQLFLKSNRPLFLWVYCRKKPTWGVGRTLKNLVHH